MAHSMLSQVLMFPCHSRKPAYSWAGLICLSLLHARPAEAENSGDINASDDEIPTPTPPIQTNASSFPVGGVVVGTLDVGVQPSDLVFSNGIGEEVSGQLVDVTSVYGPFSFGWRADPDLAAGSYSVSATNILGATFELIDDPAALPSLTYQLKEYVTGVGEPVHCERYAPKSSRSSMFESSFVNAVLDLWIDGTLATQYTYWVKIDDAPLAQFEGSYHRIDFGADPGESCFEVFAAHLLDTEPSLLEEGCVDRSLLQLGEVDETYGDLGAVLSGCVLPPIGYETAWCEYFAPAIQAGSCDGFHPVSCIAAWPECGGGSPPPEVVRQAEGAEDRSVPPGYRASASETTCTLGASSRRGIPIFLWFAPALALLRCRRRRNTPHAAKTK